MRPSPPFASRHPALYRRLLFVPLFLALQACCLGEPRKALDTPPDRECQTGVEVGYDIAIWECIQENRVVAYRSSSAFGSCSGITEERVPCGELTPFETANADEVQQECASP
ncbi:hypothetical protein [Stigmatella aurantiaca]|uniref:Lipoprotein n=2 Tax=Stigmatella aurantiaca TaxID=41 RepID=E3FWU8_STIAD|nr:hypothetical protein [Stigmatella aurantiaca]ADO69811.1 uncharacterized protein STAUR_2007 [Stigmatella aurantiaca DW4/3-1]